MTAGCSRESKECNPEPELNAFVDREIGEIISIWTREHQFPALGAEAPGDARTICFRHRGKHLA